MPIKHETEVTFTATVDMPEIKAVKPCPFCGDMRIVNSGFLWWSRMECLGCGTRTRLFRHEANAQAMWNQRRGEND